MFLSDVNIYIDMFNIRILLAYVVGISFPNGLVKLENASEILIENFLSISRLFANIACILCISQIGNK